MKQILTAIVAFFTSLFPFLSSGKPAGEAGTPTPSPMVQATPLPTPSYPRQVYVNLVMNYELLYPADSVMQESSDQQTSWDNTYTLRIDSYFSDTFDLEDILATDLMCDADGPTGSIYCKNTAVRPFTNQSGSAGFLVRRTKTIEGTNNPGEYQDTAYVFPINSPESAGVILSVEYPSEENLQVLTDTANWFTAKP